MGRFHCATRRPEWRVIFFPLSAGFSVGKLPINRRKNMTLKNFFIAVPLFVLAACGGDGNFYTGPAGTLTSATASSVKSQLGTASTVSFAKPGEVSAPGRDSDFPASCITKTPESETDADSDGIPLISTVTLNCTSAAGSGGSYTMGGTFKAVDKNDAIDSAGAGGWRFDIAYNYSLTRNGTFALTGFFDLTPSSTAYAYASNFQLTFSGTSAPDRDVRVAEAMLGAPLDRASYSLTYGSTWNHTITPDSMTTPKTSGSMTFAGYWGYKVSVSARTEANQELVLEGSSTGLKYDETCSNFYKEGTITFKAASGTMTYTFDCDNATVVKFDGTTI